MERQSPRSWPPAPVYQTFHGTVGASGAGQRRCRPDSNHLHSAGEQPSRPSTPSSIRSNQHSTQHFCCVVYMETVSRFKTEISKWKPIILLALAAADTEFWKTRTALLFRGSRSHAASPPATAGLRPHRPHYGREARASNLRKDLGGSPIPSAWTTGGTSLALIAWLRE